MRILFMDDDAQRRAYVLTELEHTNVFVTATPSTRTTISLLESGQWDAISLDHDMGDQPNGMAVVEYMVRNKSTVFDSDTMPMVLVHSWNNPAADRMCARLNEAGFDTHREHFGPSLVKLMKNHAFFKDVP